MTKDEALKLGLEALEVANSCVDGYYIPRGKTHLPEIELAITAIKEALTNEALEKMAENARELGLDYEPAQEPVAIPDCGEAGHADGACGNRECLPSFNRNTTPPPVAEPHKRTWVGLTDEEMRAIFHYSQLDNAKALEAKLKEKNT